MRNIIYAMPLTSHRVRLFSASRSIAASRTMKEKYHLLREVREDECDDGEPVQPRPTIRSIPLIYGLVPITSNVVLLAIVCFLFPYRRFSDPSVQLYCEYIYYFFPYCGTDKAQAPVNRLIEYEVQTVVGGFAYVPVRTEYMGASNNTDRLWEDLYNCACVLDGLNLA